MKEKRVKRNLKTNATAKKKVARKNTIKSKSSKKTLSKKKNINSITIVDYVFLGALVFTIIFGMQTNGAFMTPFVITLAITVVCMCIILVNAIYSKIKKKIRKVQE